MISQKCLQHFRDIGHDVEVHDVTYENVQARERTQVLMDIANKEAFGCIGTGFVRTCFWVGARIWRPYVDVLGQLRCPETLVKTLVWQQITSPQRDFRGSVSHYRYPLRPNCCLPIKMTISAEDKHIKAGPMNFMIFSYIT